MDPFIYWEFIRKVLLLMPGVTEGKAYGTPAFHVKKKFLLRLKEDDQTLAVYHEEREKSICRAAIEQFVDSLCSE
jgi:hypothetical protein